MHRREVPPRGAGPPIWVSGAASALGLVPAVDDRYVGDETHGRPGARADPASGAVSQRLIHEGGHRLGAVSYTHLDVYKRQVLHRLDKAPLDLARDSQRLTEVLDAEAGYAALLASLRPSQRGAAQVTDIAWMIEELRVSLFAQSLGTVSYTHLDVYKRQALR